MLTILIKLTLQKTSHAGVWSNGKILCYKKICDKPKYPQNADTLFTSLRIILAATSLAQALKWETVDHSSDSLGRLISSATTYAVEHFTHHSAFRKSSLIIWRQMEFCCFLQNTVFVFLSCLPASLISSISTVRNIDHSWCDS